jgi:hypothetical protein
VEPKTSLQLFPSLFCSIGVSYPEAITAAAAAAAAAASSYGIFGYDGLG